MKPLYDKNWSRDKTHEILTIDMTKSTNGTPKKQGGSIRKTWTICGTTEVPVDDPESLYLHHMLNV